MLPGEEVARAMLSLLTEKKYVTAHFWRFVTLGIGENPAAQRSWPMWSGKLDKQEK